MIRSHSPFFYLNELVFINDIKLTLREIDVLACVLSGKTSKTNSTLLMIEQKTFETHNANIKNKLGVNAKETVINHLEKNGKLSFFRNYYRFLQVEKIFKKNLLNLDLKYDDEYLLCYPDVFKLGRLYADFLKRHFECFQLKIKVIAVPLEELPIAFSALKDFSFLYVHAQSQKTQSHLFILLTLKNNKIFDQLACYKIPLSDSKDYFLNLFAAVTHIVKNDQLEIAEKNFHEQINHYYETNERHFFDVKSILRSPFKIFRKGYKKSKIILNIFIVFLVFIFLSLYTLFDFSQKYTTHSVMSLPLASYLIRRVDIFEQIDSKLLAKGINKTNINYAILIGMMGSGKTTTARMYAKSHQADIMWEFNAQSVETLTQSFFQLAYALSRTAEEKMAIDFIERIKDDILRVQQLILFVQKHLKNNPDWLLIFDNAVSLKEIENFLPKDVYAWGNGRVIVTTHNANIAKASRIKDSQCIFLDVLSLDEATNLFCQIYYRSAVHQLSESVKTQVKRFLQFIPLFPLDISVAAHFLKQTHHNFDEYLEKYFNGSPSFKQLEQEIVLEDIPYAKTRAYLMSITFEKILAENPVFKDILFFISCLNFKDIPKRLLSDYFDQHSVDMFIRCLKQYSFIMESENVEYDKSFVFLNIHPFVQECLKLYLYPKIDKNDFNELIKTNIKIINNFFEKSTNLHDKIFVKMIPHLLSFLEFFDQKLIEDEQINQLSKQTLYKFLGKIYFEASRRLADAKKCFEKALELNRETKTFSNEDFQSIYGDLAAIYTDLVDPISAQDSIQKCIMYAEKTPQRKEVIAKLFFQKGYIHILLNEQEEAEKNFEKALHEIKDLPKSKSLDELSSSIKSQNAWLFGVTYLTNDKTNKALELMNESFSYLNDEKDYKFKKNISRYVSGAYTTLGDIYCKRGQFDLAMKEGFEHALYILEHGLDNCNHFILRVYIDIGVGECLLRSGKIENARHVLKEVVEKSYTLLGKDCTLIFSPQVLLMECYLRLSQLDLAEKELMQLLSFNICEKTNHTAFMNCLLHYNAAILYKEKKDFEKMEKYFELFFEKMELFLKKFLDEQDFNILKEKDIFFKKGITLPLDQKIILWIKNAKTLLKKVYPHISFFE
jgi:DNA-binding CsgD family transcriptional regulator/predicted negative regulator of RcsB-dependent stress response